MKLVKEPHVKVYLSGPITHATDEVWKWSDRAANMLRSRGFEVISPYEHKLIGYTPVGIVNFDITLIEAVDYLLLNADAPSWGAAMEVRIAFDLDKPVVAFSANDTHSPWLTAHVKCVLPDLDKAVKYLCELEVEKS